MTRDEYYEAIEAYKNDKGFEHHGILGQKWGVRRFQNKNGTYTEGGANERRN